MQHTSEVAFTLAVLCAVLGCFAAIYTWYLIRVRDWKVFISVLMALLPSVGIANFIRHAVGAETNFGWVLLWLGTFAVGFLVVMVAGYKEIQMKLREEREARRKRRREANYG